MKCDGNKPRCSHCTTYTIDCTFSAPSRKARPKKRQKRARISEDDSSNTHDRLRHLETLIKQLTERVKAAEQPNDSPVQSQSKEQRELEIEPTIDPKIVSTLTTRYDEQLDHIDHRISTMYFPPLEHILPVIHIFLEHFNTMLPLFHSDTLLHMVHNYYDLPPPQRNPVVWAAINVVLALAYQYDLVSSHNSSISVEYLEKAQSVLSDIVLGDTHLLNVQVLIGMVLVLQASPDLTHALVMIATTMRLVHKIGLHDRSHSAHLDATETRQRACVFWMAYILDKDLSMRSKQPSIQLDDDIDLDLPSPEMAHGQVDMCVDARTGVAYGDITTVDGNAKMNYFVTRIQLAVIEGGVYDYLYSTRSSKRSPEERSIALKSVSCALETWKSSIPVEFSARVAPKSVSTHSLQLLAVLHSTSLACTTLLNQANAWNTRWMRSINEYAMEGIGPVLPPRWDSIVDEARQLSILLGGLRMQSRRNFW